MSAAAAYPRPRYVSPGQQRFGSPRQPFSRGARHEPYSVPRAAVRRIRSTGSMEGSPAALKQAADGQIIKVEPDGADDSSIEQSNVSDKNLTKSEDDSNLSGVEGHGSFEQEDTDSLDQTASSGAGDMPGATSDLDPNVSVKLEALTESELDLEITGVEPGMSVPQASDNWSLDMSFDPTGATGSSGDMVSGQGPSKWNFLSFYFYHFVLR